MNPPAKQAPRLFGTSALGILVAPILVGLAAATYGVLSSNYIAILIALVASAIELVLLPFAVRSWFMAGRPRSILGAAASVSALLAALPAAYIGLLVLNPFLPLMPWERGAIVEAEHFVKRHGFTSSGHPTDQPVLTTDIMDNLYTREQLLDHRRDSLSEFASGIVSKGFGQRIVLFEPRAGNVEGLHGYRQVEVSLGGTTYMPHQEYGFPEWMIKRVNRQHPMQ